MTKLTIPEGNNCKLEPKVEFRLTDNCMLGIAACLTLDRPFVNATVCNGKGF